MLASRQT